MNLLCNNDLSSKVWSKTMSSEIISPIYSPEGSMKGVLTFCASDSTNRANIYSSEDNIILIPGKKYSCSVYIHIREELDDYPSIKVALYQGRLYDDKMLISNWIIPDKCGEWHKVSWDFSLPETPVKNIYNRISFALTGTAGRIISLYSPEVTSENNIDINLYKGFDYINSPILLYEKYKNSCVNLYVSKKSMDKPVIGFFMKSGYVCSVYNELYRGDKKDVYAQIHPSSKILSTTLIGFDKKINIAIIKLDGDVAECAMIEKNSNTHIDRSLQVITVGRNSSKNQIDTGFVINKVSSKNINDSLFETSFIEKEHCVGQPVIAPNGLVIGMITGFTLNGSLVVPIKMLDKLFTRLVNTYKKNINNPSLNPPYELTGAFIGIRYHRAKIEELTEDGRTPYVIDDVFSNSPAMHSDLKKGDKIIAFSNPSIPVSTHSSLFEYVYTRRIGANIELLVVKQNGQQKKVDLCLDSTRHFKHHSSYL